MTVSSVFPSSVSSSCESRPLLLVPAGGLANRMRAVASALALARDAGRRLRVIWFRDWALGAPFGSVFRRMEEPDVEVTEARFAHLFTLDRPRRRNACVPRLWQTLRFDARIYEAAVTPLRRQDFDFKAWLEHARRPYLNTYTDFYPCPDGLVRTLFRPVDEVGAEVERRAALLGAGKTVGLHIRRSDHAEAIAESPLQLFFERVDTDIDAGRCTRLYLATDDEGVKAEVLARYGRRVVTAPAEASRGGVGGIRDGLADMLALARTSVIYGSAGSSFSEMAARIGGVPLEVLRQSR